MNILFQVCVIFVIFNGISCLIYTGDTIDCPLNMIPYLINENSTEEICDCEENLLYYAEDDSCYEPYRQGPCPLEHYLALSSGDTVAKCVKNPCGVDGFVPYHGKCQILWAQGKPCNEYSYLGINEKFQIECGLSTYSGSWKDLQISKSCPKDSYLKSTNEDNTSYTCECKSTFLYSAKSNSCYRAYRQGPCSPGNYFTLPRGENVPRCEKNPCHRDGLVPFRGGCYELNEIGHPCSVDFQLTVDKNTFQLHCINVYLDDDYDDYPFVGAGGIINAPRKACPPGSRRIITHCKRMFH